MAYMSGVDRGGDKKVWAECRMQTVWNEWEDLISSEWSVAVVTQPPHSLHTTAIVRHTGPPLELETEARKDFTITFKTLCLIGVNPAAHAPNMVNYV